MSKISVIYTHTQTEDNHVFSMLINSTPQQWNMHSLQCHTVTMLLTLPKQGLLHFNMEDKRLGVDIYATAETVSPQRINLSKTRILGVYVTYTNLEQSVLLACAISVDGNFNLHLYNGYVTPCYTE